MGEGGGVGNVEHFGAELDVDLFCDVGVFDEGHVEVPVGGATDGIAGGVAEGKLGRGGEGSGAGGVSGDGGVEETGGGTEGGSEGRGGDDVGALEDNAGEGIVVGGLGDGDGHSRLEREDAVEGPAAK